MADYSATPLYIKFDGYTNDLPWMYATDTYLLQNTTDLFDDYFSSDVDKILKITTESGNFKYMAFKLDATDSALFPSPSIAGVLLNRTNIVIDGYTFYGTNIT